MTTLTAANALFYAVAVAAILCARRYRRSPEPALGAMLYWFSAVAIYWLAVEAARLFFGYRGPSIFVTTIGGILWLMAPIMVLAVFVSDYIIKKRIRVEDEDDD